jgi:hypothetical protein
MFKGRFIQTKQGMIAKSKKAVAFVKELESEEN